MNAYIRSISLTVWSLAIYSAVINMSSFQRLIRRWHPIPPLLYLEWLLLAFMLVFSLGKTVLPSHWFFGVYNSFFSAAIIFIFGWTGFHLPIDKPLNQKIWFTFLELVLISLFLFSSGLRGLFLPYLILIIRSCIFFDVVGQLNVLGIVGICSFVSWRLLYRKILLLQPDHLENILTAFGVLFFIMFLLSLLFVLVMINSLKKEHKSREELAAAYQKLQQYSSLTEEQSKLQERHRIARDIHDSLGHSLTGLNLQLEAALKLWEIKPETSYKLVGESRQLAKASLQDVRHVVRELRPQNTLKDSLQKLSNKAMRWSDIKVEVVFEGNRFVPTQIQTVVYRAVQEALNNVIKHAEATQVNIYLKISKALILTVKDNGQGFQTDKARSGFGLTGMDERIKLLGGTCQVQSTLGVGTIIKVTIPLLNGES